MKKIIVLLMTLLFVLTGCGSSDTAEETKEKEASSQQEQEEETKTPGYYIQYIYFPSESTSDEQFDLLFSAAELKGLDMDIINELLVAPLNDLGVPGDISSEADFDRAFTFKEYSEQKDVYSSSPLSVKIHSRELSPLNTVSGNYDSIFLLDVYNPDKENPARMSQLIEEGCYYIQILPNRVTSSSGVATNSIETLNMVIEQAGAPDFLYAYASDQENGGLLREPQAVLNALFNAGPPNKEKGQYVNMGFYQLGYIVGDDILLIQCEDKCQTGSEPTFEITYYTLIPRKGFEIYQKEYLTDSDPIGLDVFVKALENRHIFTK